MPADPPRPPDSGPISRIRTRSGAEAGARPPDGSGDADAVPAPEPARLPALTEAPRALAWPVRGGRRAAVLQALMVTGLWSSSWVLIKLGLTDERLDPVLFAGLRYSLAALILLPFGVCALGASAVRLGDRRVLVPIAALGLVSYAVTQGAQFVALSLLPSVAVSLALASTPAVVALLGWRRRGERPSGLQFVGIVGLLAGAGLYFGRVELGEDARAGLVVAGLGTLANAASALMGRSLAVVARERVGGIVPLTALSMALGGGVLLAIGVATSGVPELSARAWTIVGWLAVVNTAAAFTLWNHTLKTLTAVESSVLNNTMLIQVAGLAWVFLGESLDARQIAGLLVAGGGVLLVQIVPAKDER